MISSRRILLSAEILMYKEFIMEGKYGKRTLVKLGILFMSVLLVVLCLAGCGGNTGEAGKKTIGVVMINFTNPFYSSASEAMKEACDELGYEYIVKSADGSLETEISLVENYIQQGVDCILVDAIEKEGVIGVFEKAAASGIPVISLFNIVNEGGSNYNCPYDHYSGFKSVAYAVFEKLGGKGNVLLLSGQKGNYASDERERGFTEALAVYPGITVLDTQPSDWDPAKGLSIVETWLTTYDNIDAILCVSDGITPSVVEAVDAAGKADSIIIAGNDGEVDVLELMQEGKVMADALLGSKRGGYLAVLYANKIINGEAVEKSAPVSTYLVADTDIQDLLKNSAVDTSWIKAVTPKDAIATANNYREEFSSYR
jgi:ribose transport system substrate-binding protein